VNLLGRLVGAAKGAKAFRVDGCRESEISLRVLLVELTGAMFKDACAQRAAKARKLAAHTVPTLSQA
jgi:hypothetical protein